LREREREALAGHKSTKKDGGLEEEQMEHPLAVQTGSDKKKKRGRRREGRYIGGEWRERGR
jgi:hypothetical protein